MSLEASLGKDLQQVQQAIIAAKCQLAQLNVSNEAAATLGQHTLQEVFNDSLGEQLTKDVGVLGKPKLDDVLANRKGWFRWPYGRELAVANDRSSMVLL